MNTNINIEAIKADLNNNIDIYIKSVSAGDELSEKIAKKAKKKIKNCEQKLKEIEGENLICFDFDNLNIEKSPLEENINQEVLEENKITESFLKPLEEKSKKSTIAVKVELDNLENLETLSNQYQRSLNNIVSLLFENLYDSENKKLNFDIASKASKKTKPTSYILKKEIIDALDSLAKEKGYSRTELFNIILENKTKEEVEKLNNK